MKSPQSDSPSPTPSASLPGAVESHPGLATEAPYAPTSCRSAEGSISTLYTSPFDDLNDLHMAETDTARAHEWARQMNERGHMTKKQWSTFRLCAVCLAALALGMIYNLLTK